MSNASEAAEMLLVAAEEYAPSVVAPGTARLAGLDLFIEVRELQAMDAGFMSLFISEFEACEQPGKRGIIVTCVGRAESMAAAVNDAVLQWGLGVLPVLAQWRGKHSCLSAGRKLAVDGGGFTVVAGPTIVRGRDEEEQAPAGNFSELVEVPLRGKGLANRLHWLEMFACRSADGTIDATCRLDNRDWSEGNAVLKTAAAGWTPSQEPLVSSRQFAMLLPEQGDAQKIVVPSFWARLFGRG